MNDMSNAKPANIDLVKDDCGLAWVTFDLVDTSTNILSSSVLSELGNVLDQIEEMKPVGIIFRSAKKSGFIAGADVSEFTTLESEDAAYEYIRTVHALFNRIESLPWPTVCVIHGFCLGGGTEMALACNYRLAEDDDATRIGLPEVLLGIHPGYGGSVRLPPLVGHLNALDMMLSGRSLRARSAARIGLVDAAVPRRQLEIAAQQIALTGKTRRKTPGLVQRLSGHRLLRPVVARFMKKQVIKKANPKHYPAPFALIDLWRNEMDNRVTMMEKEARSVARLINTDTARNLIRVFFLQTQLKDLGRASDFKARHVHVVGAGIMGGDIAAWCAMKGLNVSLQDQSPERIAPAIARAHKLFSKKLRKPRPIQAAMDRLMPDPQGVAVEQADVVIEAIFEDLDAKRSLFKELEPRMKADALLATNTSSIPLEELSENLQQPDRLVGLHFFNPVAKMQLVEVVQGKNTHQDRIHQAAAFTRQIGRLPLTVASSPGFLVNRILMPYLLEAVRLIEAGVPAEIIDKAAKDFGMPMGPVELADTVGLDICLSVARILSEHLGGDVPDILQDEVSAGHLGRKSGRGFYRYHKGKPVRSKKQSSPIPEDDVQDRLILRYLNEAVRCINESVVSEGDLLDAGMIFGTGFAPFRGGPIHYILDKTAIALEQRMNMLQDKYHNNFKPDSGWQRYHDESPEPVQDATESETNSK